MGTLSVIHRIISHLDISTRTLIENSVKWNRSRRKSSAGSLKWQGNVWTISATAGFAYSGILMKTGLNSSWKDLLANFWMKLSATRIIRWLRRLQTLKVSDLRFDRSTHLTPDRFSFESRAPATPEAPQKRNSRRRLRWSSSFWAEAADQQWSPVRATIVASASRWNYGVENRAEASLRRLVLALRIVGLTRLLTPFPPF